jgi:hypothetical protein
MQEPAERHLTRRQSYSTWLLQDLVYQAYLRARALRPQLWPPLPSTDFRALFTVSTPDVSRSDNHLLAQATERLAVAFDTLLDNYPGSPTLRKLLLSLLLRFAGHPQDDQVLSAILEEAAAAAAAARPPAMGANAAGQGRWAAVSGRLETPSANGRGDGKRGNHEAL